MDFYIQEFKGEKINLVQFPCIVLTTDYWDDWSLAETLFHATYYFEKKKTKSLGDIKIMTNEGSITRNYIPSHFTGLSDEYSSLGQSLEFYKKLSSLPSTEHHEILEGLRDSATNPDIANKFKNTEIFTLSLLRFSEAEKAFKEAKNLFGGNEEKILEFEFTHQLDEADEAHKVKLDFVKCDLPYRLNAFVGKNATGKTKILTELAKYISGVEKDPSKFSPARPSFSKIIAISYSAFDDLYKPFEDFRNSLNENNEELTENSNDSEYFSYKYCGLRSKKGILSLEDLEKQFWNSYSIVKERKREKEWKELLENVFEKDNLQKIYDLDESMLTGTLSNHLSSGQNILLTTFTDIIANIEEDSLLLFDEPELHLHPNAIANFMRMYYGILEKFNSFSVISTHSPLIIQEVPSKYVKVFSRIQKTPSVRSPYLECFGENVSSITDEIFDVSEYESNYKTTFKKLAEKHEKKEIMSLFGNGLSFNSLTYLNTIFKRKES
nr:AAA family ATPase [Exiguobacterium indicum]